jgi:hypothetical protein
VGNFRFSAMHRDKDPGQKLALRLIRQDCIGSALSGRVRRQFTMA